MAVPAPCRARQSAAVAHIDTLIIGAGPSGLTAADRLVAAGRRPLLVERSPYVGGLMRSIRHGLFTVDLGRKELYSRIPEIDTLWNAVLGASYRPYPHRVGSLFGGRILELAGRYRGPARGMPPGLLVRGGIDLLRGWTEGAIRKPVNYECYWYQRAGRSFARALAQGYWEKFRGQAWRDLPAPTELADGQPSGSHSFAAIAQGLKMASRGGASHQTQWRHPALGTGELTDRLAGRIRDAGGEIRMETEVVALRVEEDGTISATLARDGEVADYRAEAVISSMAPEALAALLGQRNGRIPSSGSRAVVLVYLFLDEPPRFPHAWLEVNDPLLAAGRITNYAAFRGKMVPPGMTALCVEYFLGGQDSALSRSDGDWAELAVGECVKSGLIGADRVMEAMTVRMERCNAAASWREAQEYQRAGLYAGLRGYPRLFHVHRPGTDWASFAGLCAAEAVLTGNREAFDRRADPTRSYVSANPERGEQNDQAPWHSPLSS